MDKATILNDKKEISGKSTPLYMRKYLEKGNT
jgi:hypothetical protein